MSVETLPRTRPPVFLDLASYGDRLAVATADGTLTYDQLAERVDTLADTLGDVRRLVLVAAANTLDGLVSYLAALTRGHVVLLAPARSATEEVVAAYQPDVVIDADGLHEHRAGTGHDLHPDLALLLSTSGSTGSPQLVRLSHDNLASNAAAIADYLQLTDRDRAITSLPLHYCYGLSVVHSHLLVGAGLVLTDLSVVDDCFWQLAHQHGATSFAGVPHTFDLLEHSGFAERDLPSLRYVTQAGGRMPPAQVRAWSELGQARGWDLFVMYGQTEATSRMAWLPPDLARAHPETVGVPVAGGTFRIEPEPGCAPGVGELVYSGPNVMMGYAATADDLARGPELTELRTGDLARLTDGLVEIVGRRSRVAKVFGLRLDLERLERGLDEQGMPAHLVATDDRLWAFTTHGRRHRQLTAHLCALTGLPTSAVRPEVVAAVPLTASGKPDFAALARHARSRTAEHDRGSGDDRDVAALYARVLGLTSVDPRRSFVELGGDSLSYVELATRLERLLPGGLPPDWCTTPIASLTARPGVPRRGRSLDTTIALRAVCIVAIVASHADLVSLMGGAHVLLAVVGFNLARFQLSHRGVRERWRHGLRSVAMVVVPSSLWIGGVTLLTGRYDTSTVLLVNGFVGGDRWTDDWQFWFVEVVLWSTVAALALLSWPALARWERRRPFGVAATVTAAALAGRFATVGIEAGPTQRYATAVVACFVALGWAAARATHRRQRLSVSLAAVVMTAGFFGDVQRELLVIGGILVLVWLPALPLPTALAEPVVRMAGVLAASSLCVYLTHWQVYRPLEDAGHPWLAFAASFGLGIVVWLLSRRLAPSAWRTVVRR